MSRAEAFRAKMEVQSLEAKHTQPARQLASELEAATQQESTEPQDILTEPAEDIGAVRVQSMEENARILASRLPARAEDLCRVPPLKLPLRELDLATIPEPQMPSPSDGGLTGGNTEKSTLKRCVFGAYNA